jgi:hypothetical protein
MFISNVLHVLLSKLFIHEPSLKKEKEKDDQPTRLGGFLLVIRSKNDLTEGAVALIRIESDTAFNIKQPERLRQEFVCYPHESDFFFTLVTESLSRNIGVTIHTNQDPVSLGLIQGDNGHGRITRVEQLGGA